jgi:hypothetical protein
VKKIFTAATNLHQLITTTKLLSLHTTMSMEQLDSYVTYLTEFKVIVCRFCQCGIPPNDPLRHYELNHTAKKGVYISVDIRHQVRDYMSMLDLCEPHKVMIPNRLISELKIISRGFICKFSGCNVCGTSESSMRTHYYTHQKHNPKDFRGWEESRLQTFFEGCHRK